MNLRPYQEEAVSAIHEQWRQVDRTLLVLPTGCGKTIVFSSVTRDIVEAGGRVLIMAHRGELLEQAADKLARATGLGCAVEKAEQQSHDSMFGVTVGSVQTLCRPARLARFAEDHFTHIIIDEAHHCLAESYQAAVRYFGKAKVLGVTATPDRNDRRNLGTYFESLAYEYSFLQAVRDGYLVKPVVQCIPLKIDLSKVRIQSGDFASGDLDKALEPYLEQIADEMAGHCMDRKTLVFTPLVATAQKFAAMLKAKGFNAEHVSGEDPERAAKLSAYANAGPGSVLCNSMLLTEGYDDPATDCIVCLRPTKSRPLYAQMIGRGTRILDGKKDLLILDFLWLTEKHELCRPASLVASSPDEAKALTKMAEAAGVDGMELDDKAISEAQRDVIREREERLAEELKRQRGRQRKLVDPLQWAVSVNAADLSDYQPEFGWEMAPPSKKQAEQLEKAGIFPDQITCAGMASKLLDRLQARRAAGFATPKQIRCLERFGFRHVGEMQFAEATRIITRLSANAWRLPDDLAERIRRSNAPKANHVQMEIVG
jgi:superfamily II DNA or RNA helicase